MKKMAIFAAVAAMVGVSFAADCSACNECSSCGPTCAFAYRVKLSGKTVIGKSKTVAAVSACSQACADECWAKPASYRVAGYIYGSTGEETTEGTCGACTECKCNTFEEGSFKTIFWNANKVQKFSEEAGYKVTFRLIEVLRNGGAKNKAQVAICINAGDSCSDGYGLVLAGFGAYNPNSNKLKNASGFFAGVLPPPNCTTETETCPCEEPVEPTITPASIFEICTLASAESKGAATYGRWNMAYKADKVAAYEKTGSEDTFKPTGFKASTADAAN